MQKNKKKKQTLGSAKNGACGRSDGKYSSLFAHGISKNPVYTSPLADHEDFLKVEMEIEG